uniref:Uncharacterized protein n=1 Tax=Parascaris equorum TaxID=6256 RepID=A0A914R658_PAREQ
MRSSPKRCPAWHCKIGRYFSDELWRAVKVRSEYGSVLKQVQEAKRRKEDELLNLPKNVANGPGPAPPTAAPPSG